MPQKGKTAAWVCLLLAILEPGCCFFNALGFKLQGTPPQKHSVVTSHFSKDVYEQTNVLPLGQILLDKDFEQRQIGHFCQDFICLWAVIRLGEDPWTRYASVYFRNLAVSAIRLLSKKNGDNELVFGCAVDLKDRIGAILGDRTLRLKSTDKEYVYDYINVFWHRGRKIVLCDEDFQTYGHFIDLVIYTLLNHNADFTVSGSPKDITFEKMLDQIKEGLSPRQIALERSVFKNEPGSEISFEPTTMDEGLLAQKEMIRREMDRQRDALDVYIMREVYHHVAVSHD